MTFDFPKGGKKDAFGGCAVDTRKLTETWRMGAEEDLEVAGGLIARDRLRHGLFFAELAVEKLLKACVVAQTKTAPPRTHDLLRLADLAGIKLAPPQRLFLARIQEYCLEGRYPDLASPSPGREEAEQEFQRCREFMAWLTSQFK